MHSLGLIGVVWKLLDHLHMTLHQVTHRLDKPQIRIQLPVLLTWITHDIIHFKMWQPASNAAAMTSDRTRMPTQCCLSFAFGLVILFLESTALVVTSPDQTERRSPVDARFEPGAGIS